MAHGCRKFTCPVSATVSADSEIDGRAERGALTKALRARRSATTNIGRVQSKTQRLRSLVVPLSTILSFFFVHTHELSQVQFRKIRKCTAVSSEIDFKTPSPVAVLPVKWLGFRSERCV